MRPHVRGTAAFEGVPLKPGPALRSAPTARDADGLPGSLSQCDSQPVTFGLEPFAVGVDAKAAIWAKLGVVWRLEPISPNYGKPVVRGVFESVTWVGDVTVWITGEAELLTFRLADGWNLNKHYDLASPGDLEIALDELAALIAQGSVPDEAVTAWGTRGQ